MAKELGYSAGLSGKGHLRLFDNAGKVVAHMPSSLSPRNVHNARAQLKRAALKEKEPQQ